MDVKRWMLSFLIIFLYLNFILTIIYCFYLLAAKYYDSESSNNNTILALSSILFGINAWIFGPLTYFTI